MQNTLYSKAMSGIINTDGTLNSNGIKYIKERPLVIESLIQLKELADESDLEIFIRLKHNLRSSKIITYYNDIDKWYIINEIDGTDEVHTSTDDFILNYPLLFKAIKTRNLFLY